MSSASTATADDLPITTPSSLDLLRDRHAVWDQIRHGRELPDVLRRSLLVALAGAAAFGLSVGFHGGSWAQILASAIKMPILLLGTAALCFPAFFVLQSWRAPRPLAIGESLALQSTMLGAVALVWGSLAPPVLFLVTSTQHYRLSQFLAVVVGAAGGVVGLGVLLSGYRSLCRNAETGRSGGLFLATYFLLFSLIGGQLAWMLRPFIGSPEIGFSFFRPLAPEDGNFFTFLLHMLFG